MTLCDKIPKDGRYRDMGELEIKLQETIAMYADCRSRHNALVEYETKKVK